MGITTDVRNNSFAKVNVGSRQQEIIDLLSNSKGMTAWEIADALGREVYTVRPRLTELMYKGAVMPLSTKYQARTDREETIWGYTGENYYAG